MKNPLLNINLETIELPAIVTREWFNDNNLELKKIQFEGVETVDKKLLKKELEQWNAQVERVHIDNDTDEGFLYDIAPVDSDISISYLDQTNSPASIEIEDYVYIDKEFSYVLKIQGSDTPIGLITGSYSASGPVEMDLEDDNSKELELVCNIDAIILAPEQRGQGLGKTITESITALGLQFFESVLSQIPEKEISDIIFTPSVQADLYSRSGSRWFDHLYTNFGDHMFFLLESYVNEENIKETTYDASL